jgi:hypothetical protein
MVLDVEAVQEVALVDDHVSVTPRPKLIEVACAGVENETVGMAGGGGGGGVIGAL